MTDVLRTARLDLVLLDPDRARVLATGANPNGREWAKGYPVEATLLSAELTVAAADRGRPLGDFGIRQMVRRDGDVVIGDAGFLGPPDATGAVHLGIGVARSARRQGYATEAVRALLDWARDQDGLTCVLADTTRSSVAARRLLERVGMHQVGQDGELLYYMS